MLDADGDDYAITAAVIQRAARLEAEVYDQLLDAFAARVGNAVGKALGG